MKNNVLLILILLVILVTACQGGTPEATVAPEPTVAPTDMPTEEAAPEPTEAGADTESATEEATTEEAAEVGDTTSGSMDEQLELLAALAPPPQLSDKELGIYTVPCLPGTSLGFGEVEGEDYYCGIFKEGPSLTGALLKERKEELRREEEKTARFVRHAGVPEKRKRT